MKNICILVGARPNFIKVAPLIRAIQNSGAATYRLLYAGKETDATLEDTLFSDLRMPPPDTFLGVDSSSLNEITSLVMARFDHYLDHQPADIVIVVDDLASTMAAAIVAKKRGLTLAHLVAGTRSFDMKMPKEVNRLVIDALSDILFTAGIKSSSVATREQAEGSNTYMVGNILMDTLRFCQPYLRKPQIQLLDATPLPKYIVLTINRRALLADPEKLRQLIQAITQAVPNIPIIAPLRPEAATIVESLASHLSPLTSHLSPLQPLPYLEFAWLTAHATGIITDSGNVAEEATFNGVPCITLNSYTEHQETVTVGTNVLVGEDPQRLAEETGRMVSGQWKQSALPQRWDGRTAERIVKILLEK